MSKENKGLAPPASQDRVTDERSREGASPPSGSVPTGAEFLPGPWFIKDGLIRAPDLDPNGQPEAPWCVAQVFPFAGHGGDRSVANANLIAAAPELFEALLIAVAVLDRAGIIWMGEVKARAALAKARGETSHA